METTNNVSDTADRVQSAQSELNVPPDFTAPITPISEFVTHPDFPECVLGQHLDIGGYTGVAIAVVKQSIKVKSAEGLVRSFKSYGLQRIYGPPPEHIPVMESPPAAPGAPTPTPEPVKAAPPREVIEEPNFDQPIVPIVVALAVPNFPQGALGQHLEIGGYTGVVVEIIQQSLKVRSRQGTSRNYNINLLRKIYGTTSKAGS